MHFCVPSRKTVPVSGIHWHSSAPPPVAVLLWALLYRTVESAVVERLCVEPSMCGSSVKAAGMYLIQLMFKVLYCKIKNVFLIFGVCFLCIICVKSIINPVKYSTV